MGTQVKTDFVLGGEKEYRQALTNINNSMKVLDSEMKKTQSAYKNNADSIGALSKKNDVLERKILSQTDKVETLRAALQASAEKYGEADNRTMKWQTSLNLAEANLNDMNNELAENKKKMDASTDSTEKADKELQGLGDVVGQVSNKFGINLPDGVTKSMNALGAVGGPTVVAITALAALATALAKVEQAFFDCTLEAASYADNIMTMSQQTGLSTETLQEFSYSAELIDVSVETIQGSLAKLTRNMSTARKGTGDAAVAFKELGIKVTDSSGNLRDSDEVFYQAIAALGKIEDYTERDALAMAIFGKSAQDLDPLIIQGTDRLRELGDEAHRVGYVLNDEALTALGNVDDAFQRMNLQIEAAKNNFGTKFAPYTEEALKTVSESIETLGDALIESGAADSFGELLDISVELLPITLDFAKEALPYIKSSLEGMTEALRALSAVLDGIQSIGDKIEKTFESIFGSKTLNSIKSIFTVLQSYTGMGNPFATIGAVKDLFGQNASGTDNWRGGRTLVGENGPELVSLPRGSSIATAQETRSMGGDTFYVTIDAKNVKEFNDIINVVREQRLRGRMGGGN